MLQKFTLPFCRLYAWALLFFPFVTAPTEAQQKSTPERSQRERVEIPVAPGIKPNPQHLPKPDLSQPISAPRGASYPSHNQKIGIGDGTPPQPVIHPLNPEALAYARQAFEAQWRKKGDFHFSKDDTGRIWELNETTSRVEAAALRKVDTLNGITWKGTIIHTWAAHRIFYADKGWTEWVDGGSIQMRVLKKNGVWRTLSASFPYRELRETEAAFKYPTFTSLGLAEIERLERFQTMDEEQSLSLLTEFAEMSSGGVSLRPRILSQVKPKYTQEGRANKIQGKVVLLVEFRADGTIGAVRVIRGLGHGLDENAIAAARQIRFQPATNNGVRATVTSRVEFSFTLL
jgi:TonB family protein